jgi:polyisoprenoid-binding protein YceI
VAKYPEAVLVITKAGAFKGNKAEITANVTIKGKTNPNTFTVTKTGDVYTANIVVDRSKYDVKYGSKSFFEDIGDKVIYDEFKLDVELVATK